VRCPKRRGLALSNQKWPAMNFRGRGRPGCSPTCSEGPKAEARRCARDSRLSSGGGYPGHSPMWTSGPGRLTGLLGDANRRPFLRSTRIRNMELQRTGLPSRALAVCHAEPAIAALSRTKLEETIFYQ